MTRDEVDDEIAKIERRISDAERDILTGEAGANEFEPWMSIPGTPAQQVQPIGGTV